MREGRCFLCKQQGHMARNCPSRIKTNIRSIQENEPNEETGEKKTQESKETNVTQVRQLIQELSVQEFGELMNQMAKEHQESNEGEGF